MAVSGGGGSGANWEWSKLVEGTDNKTIEGTDNRTEESQIKSYLHITLTL